MDHNEITPDLSDINFSKEIAKAFLVSTAVSAGSIAGFLVIGLAITKFEDYKEARQAKKDAKTAE
jgi:hypothetical protein